MEDRRHRRGAAVLSRLGALAAALAAAAALVAGCGEDERDEARPATRSGPSTTQGAGRAAPAPGEHGAERGAGNVPWRAPRALVRELDSLAAGRGAPAGAALAAAAGGPVAVAGPLRSQRAWSTIKVPLLVTYLQRVRGARSLSAGERADARAMITVSANEPANRLFLALAAREGGVGAATRAVAGVLRAGGDADTRVSAQRPDGRRTFTWLGQTRWRLADGVRWYRALADGTVARRADTRFVLDLMRRVEGSRWGLRTALAESVPLAYKVGVGTDPDGLTEVEQYAIAGRGPGACVLAVAARGADEASAKATADRLARALTRPLREGRGCR